ncbi:MAG: DNA translocase FtsK 4TM domain-containing protein, partial [Bacteroidales bacterium]|nr:DNA translocase FtsK 4TM domain-containing protein [Bacteroidales bacterium]
MSKKNKKTSSKISPKKRKKSRKIKRTLSVISGWLLIIFSVYSALAMTSYLINWFQSKVSIDIETAGFWNYLINSEIHTHNFTGKFGDVISTILIKQWFGISSFLLLTLLFHFGIKLIFRVNIFRKRFYTSAILFITLWLSTFLALCLQNNNSNILAGNVGIYSYDKLNSIIGIFGTAIALGVILFVLLGLRYHINILKIFKKSSNEDSKTGKEGKTSGKKDKYGNLIEEDTQENFREGLNNNKDNDEVNDDEDNDEKQVYEDNDADNEIDTVSDDDISNKISNSDKEQADCENSSEDEEEDF